MNNKFTTYFLYAIGEIVLVVIGILIAVNIDDWNTEKANEKEVQKTFLSIADDLRDDIAFLEEAIDDLAWKSTFMQKLINDEFTKEEWIKNDSVFYSFITYPDFEVDIDNVSVLKTKSPESSMSKELSNKIIKFYKKFQVEIDIRNREVYEVTFSNLSYWRANTIWYSQSLVDHDHTAIFNYAKENPYFRNRITHKSIMNSRLHTKFKEYEEAARLVILDIEKATSKIP